MAVAGGFRTFLFRQVIVLIYAAGPRLPPWAVSRLVQIVHQQDSLEGYLQLLLPVLLRMIERRDVGLAMRHITLAVRALFEAMDTTGCTKRGDWTEWMRVVSVELLRQSPSRVLRPCAALAEAHQPVAQDLFNAAFLTVWDELFMENWEGDNTHSPVIEAIQSALSSPSLPPEIQTQLLNLAGFMELQDKSVTSVMESDFGFAAGGVGWGAAWEGVPAAVPPGGGESFAGSESGAGGPGSVSGGGGRSCSGSGPNPDTLEALISVNHKLGLDMAAAGILRQAEQQAEAGLCEFVVRPAWLEKLWRPAVMSRPAAGRQGSGDSLLGGAGGGESSAAAAAAAAAAVAAVTAAAVVAGPSPAVSRSSSAGLMPGVGPAAAAAVKGGAAGGDEHTPAFDPDRMHLGSFNSDEAFAEVGPAGAPASSSAAAAVMGMGGAGAWSGGFDGGLSTTDVVVEWYQVMLGRLRCLDALGEHRKEDWARVGVGREPAGGFSAVAAGARGPRAPKMLPPPALATKAAVAAAAAASATTTTTTVAALTTMTVPAAPPSTTADPSLASRSTDSMDLVGGAPAAASL
ncbi:unnamed protein product, partial [Ectocarpus sp. 6 AP-2014]